MDNIFIIFLCTFSKSIVEFIALLIKIWSKILIVTVTANVGEIEGCSDSSFAPLPPPYTKK